MREKVATALVVTVTLPMSVCNAEWLVSNVGSWPKSWPAELEPLRAQSRTLSHTGYTMYHVPFTDRGKFEAAWPHVLSIATDGSPVTLSRGHDRWTAVQFDAGVVIVSPNTGKLIASNDKNVAVYPSGAESSIPGGRFLRVGPPWPDEIRDESGIISTNDYRQATNVCDARTNIV